MSPVSRAPASSINERIACWPSPFLSSRPHVAGVLNTEDEDRLRRLTLDLRGGPIGRLSAR